MRDKSKRRFWEYIIGLGSYRRKRARVAHPEADSPGETEAEAEAHPELAPAPAILSLKDAYKRASPPPDTDAYIREGIRRAKRELARKKRKKRATGAAVAVLLVLALSAALGFSPAFASFVGKLTTQLLDSKDGLHIAAEQGYMQRIGKSVEHDGIELRIEDLIVDELRMVMYYSIKDKNGYDSVRIQATSEDTATGEEYTVGQPMMSSGSDIFSSSGTFSGPWENGAMEIRWKEDAPIPDKLRLRVTMHVPMKPGYQKTVQLDKEWNLSFSIRKDQIVAKQVFELNETVSLDGQNVTFTRATLLPTAIRLDLSIDPNNSKQLFSIEDLRLVDQDGLELKPLRGFERQYFVYPVTRPKTLHTIYFEGSLLANPQSLDLVGSTIRALDKSKREIIVDTREKKLLKVPDERIKLVDVNKYPNRWEFSFELQKDVDNKFSPHMIDIHSLNTMEQRWLDPSNGYGLRCGGYSSSEETVQKLNCVMTGSELMGEYLPEPFVFRIYDYHYNKIHQPFRVKIK
ncbi:DUF4179 domain-containing protein [Paenibacillus sp. GCM10012303]|uniref:DUF4179 domain-containing protein n=1 Tax=Paenibacillus sp. GCM10012303 TaxID=3317340 RepID=UPI00360F7817